jgi:hypothetical protein
LGATVRATVRVVPWLAIEAGVDGLVPLVRYRFAVEGPTGTAFQPSPVAVVGYAGVGVRFW